MKFYAFYIVDLYDASHFAHTLSPNVSEPPLASCIFYLGKIAGSPPLSIWSPPNFAFMLRFQYINQLKMSPECLTL